MSADRLAHSVFMIRHWTASLCGADGPYLVREQRRVPEGATGQGAPAVPVKGRRLIGMELDLRLAKGQLTGLPPDDRHMQARGGCRHTG
jgi:hypothetical protein